MKRWYAVHTQARAEEKALRNLSNQGFESYLPMTTRRRRHARRVEVVRTPLFPRYLFVAFDPDECQWRSINGTLGVCYLISNGSSPVPLPEGFVPALTEWEERPAGFAPGEELRIGHGRFADLTGRFESMTDDGRVVVLLKLLGRDVRTTVGLDWVESAA